MSELDTTVTELKVEQAIPMTSNGETSKNVPGETTTMSPSIPTTPTDQPTDNETCPDAPKRRRRRKRKQSYRDMMNSITHSQRTDEEVRTEHLAKIQAGLGGGRFSKFERLE